jgi:hypothetical protein
MRHQDALIVVVTGSLERDVSTLADRLAGALGPHPWARHWTNR